jgi:hypothetical protein
LLTESQRGEEQQKRKKTARFFHGEYFFDFNLTKLHLFNQYSG